MISMIARTRNRRARWSCSRRWGDDDDALGVHQRAKSEAESLSQTSGCRRNTGQRRYRLDGVESQPLKFGRRHPVQLCGGVIPRRRLMVSDALDGLEIMIAGPQFEGHFIVATLTNELLIRIEVFCSQVCLGLRRHLRDALLN